MRSNKCENVRNVLDVSLLRRAFVMIAANVTGWGSASDMADASDVKTVQTMCANSREMVTFVMLTKKDYVMTIEEQVNEGIKEAMKAHDKIRLEALRNIKKVILEAKTKPGAGGQIDDAACIKIIQNLAKQSAESAAVYKEHGRTELYEQETGQLAVLNTFLPEQLTDEQLTQALRDIVAKVGASSAKDMGKVMGVATKELAGRADGKAISSKVKELLG